MFGVHLLLAVGLAAFAQALSPSGVLLAFVLVFLVLWAGERWFGVRAYVRRVRAGSRFVLWFLREVVLASVDVARLVLSRRVEVSPAVVAIRLRRRDERVVTLIACLLTLTPGTMALEYHAEEGLLYVHALDARNDEEVRASIAELEWRLLAWLESAEDEAKGDPR